MPLDGPLDSDSDRARQAWLRGIIEEMGRQVNMRSAHTDYDRAKMLLGLPGSPAHGQRSRSRDGPLRGEGAVW